MTANKNEFRSFWTHLYDTAFKLDWIEVDGLRTRYMQAGPADAPAVIMLHGVGASLEGFVANIAAYAKHFNVIALDFWGTGLSDKPNRDYEIADYVEQVVAFMGAKAIKKASFVGVSLGSWVSAAIAVAHPDKVEKLVLVSMMGFLSIKEYFERADVDIEDMKKIHARRQQAVDNPSWETISPIFNQLILKEENRIDDVIAIRLNIYRRPEMKLSMPHVMFMTQLDVGERNIIPQEAWRKLQAPVLMVEAPDSPDISFEAVHMAMKVIPKASMISIPGASHWAQFEAYEMFNSGSIDFLLAA